MRRPSLLAQAFARLLTNRAALAFAVLSLLATLSSPLHAQRTDVVRGRVTDLDTMPIAGATVVVTDTVARTPRPPVRTDARGAFSVSVDNGSGTYMVVVTMLGYGPQRRVVTRAGDGSIAPLTFKMSQVAAQLGAVRSVGERPRPPRSEAQGDAGVGGQANYVNLSGGLTGDVTGDLTSALASIPGITLTPSATGGLPSVSAFGIGGDQNNVVLNGLGFGGSVPRDGFSLGVVTATYDPSRGGFAGVQQSLRMNGGSNFIQRTLHATIDAPSLQWTTPVASQVAGRYGQQIVSGALSGPIVLDHLFYSTSFQVQRRASGLPSLLSADPASLTALRISPDSVGRLFAVLGPTGIPLRTADVPAQRENMETRLATRVDWVPHPAPSNPGLIIFGPSAVTQDAYYAQLGGTVRSNDGAMTGVTSVPSFGGQQTHRDGWGQITAAKYLPHAILNETSVSLSGSIDRTEPYLSLPAARILVTSTLDDGQLGLSSLQVGGSSQPRTDSRSWLTELRNQTSLTTWDRKHAAQLTLSASEDGYSVNQDAGFGSYAFNSLADFANGVPASYSRTLTSQSRSGHGINGAIGIGDVWTPKSPGPTGAQTGPTFQYGVRLEGNHLEVHPAFNRQVDSVFHLRTDHVPSTGALMPMLGFRWPAFGNYMTRNGINFGPRALISGGIREYRGTFATRNIDSYTRQTGLPDAIQQLYCVGGAAPAPDWRGFENGDIPTTCADGTVGTVLSQTTPPVSVLAPDYRLFESWRPAVLVNYRLSDWLVGSVNGTYADNRHGASPYDVNFNGTPQFALSNEGGRPVYVAPSSIVPATGTAAWTESRVSQLFAHVAETRSDLRSRSSTIGGTIAYSPIIFAQSAIAINGSIGYSFSDSREQYRGFFQTTDGDPRTVGWSRGSQARHAIVLNAAVRQQRWGAIQLFGRIQSGMFYTPTVLGDINGDGYNDDRAFVFNPAAGGDTAITNAMSRLLATAPSGARECLQRQLGTVAGRASCTAPWAMTNLSMQILPDPYRLGLGNRGSLSIYVNNILSGLDQALHGSDRLHGWGQSAIPDASLLTVRGFDPASRQFRYTVNPLFGNTSVFRNTFRSPFQITVDFRVDISPDRETQYLESLLRPRKAEGIKSYTEAQIKQKIARGINPATVLLAQKDSLGITPAEADSMQRVAAFYMAKRDSVATAVAKFLASRNGDYAGEEVRSRWHAAGLATYKAFLDGYRGVFAVLTPEQTAHARKLTTLSTILDQINGIKDSDLRIMFRNPLPSLP